MNEITLPTLGIRRLSPTIQTWFQKANDPKTRGWDAEGLEHDLILMATSNTWTGVRKMGSMKYAATKLMDRLEILQAQYPDLAFFVGTFPRIKGQACLQILWYSDTDMGCESDLD